MHVIATAGHVDHGKSMLVRALTGMEPDRWEAEQRRGMTIDLGFAWMTLPSGEQVAFVDVPGHERFVSNMLAGAGPAPAVMFVVAADEGWMPQSDEHLAAIDALGVRHGVLVITRADLADPQPALGQASRTIAATGLGELEAVAVSAVTGQGLSELVAALDRLAAQLPPPDPDSGVRLWLDRVFAIKGSGTVVTGTLQAGTVRAGEELTATPSMRPVRVRGVQSLGSPAAQVDGVARVALNLRGVSKRELGRGMALIHAGRWTVTSVIDVRLEPPSARGGQPPGAIRLPPRMTLHIGAARAIARIRILGGRFARLSLDRPLPLHVGDRMLLRDPGAAATAASGQPVYGATVLDVMPPRLRGNGAAAAAHQELASWPELPTAPDLLHRHRLLRATTARAMGLTDLPQPVTKEWLADPDYWRQLRRRLAEAVAAHAARDPLAPGLPVEAARAQLGLPDRDLVEALAASTARASEPIEAAGGYLRKADGNDKDRPDEAGQAAGPGQQPDNAGQAASPGQQPDNAGQAASPGQQPDDAGQAASPGQQPDDASQAASPGQRADGADGTLAQRHRPAVMGAAARASQPHLPAPVAAAVQAVLADLADAPFSAPDAERMRELGLDARAAAAAERVGLLCRLPGNVLLAPDAPERAARILADLPQPFTAAEARRALGTSRRVAIPLLEWLDRAGVTRRLTDDRRAVREPPRSQRPNGGR